MWRTLKTVYHFNFPVPNVGTVQNIYHAEGVQIDELHAIWNKKRKQTTKPKASTSWKPRYYEAWKKDQVKKHPQYVSDFGFDKCSYPIVSKSNGLTTAIVNYVDWEGGVGNRINTMGREVAGRMIKSATKRGTGDTDLTAPNGVNFKVEVKIAPDKPRPEQLEMQRRIRAVGGWYDFVYTMEEFFELYDRVMASRLF